MENTNDKKRLILISPMLHQGGFERVCITTARLLEPYYDVSIVIFDDSDIAYDISGLDIINLNLGVKKGRIFKAINSLRRARALKRVKNELKPVAAYSFGPTANYVNCLSKTKDTKVLAGLRGFTNVESPLELKFFIKRADLVISCSKEMNEVLKESYGFDKAVVLYNPFDVEGIKRLSEELKPTLPWGDTDDEGRKIYTFVSMGRVDLAKGYWHLIKAFYLVRGKIPNVRLLIFGDGDFGEYQDFAEKLGCWDDMYFAGLQKKPYPYLKAGDIYLLTSENEGFPNALIEAMALEIPVVSVDCESGPKEILLSDEEMREYKGRIKGIYEAEYGIICEAVSKGENFDTNDLDEEKYIAEAVMRLLNDADKRIKYGKKASERAMQFNSEKYIRQLIEQIEYSQK